MPPCAGNTHRDLQCYSKGCRLEGKKRRDIVIDLKYLLVIEATEDGGNGWRNRTGIASAN